MREDVRRAALEAAAKLTVTVLALGGCTESPPPQTAASASPSTTASNATAAPASATTPPPEVDCEAEVKAAFPKSGAYPGAERSVSPVVSRCCEKLLLAKGSQWENRWDCCANLPKGSKSDNVNVRVACTPWGPPVPPAMIV